MKLSANETIQYEAIDSFEETGTPRLTEIKKSFSVEYFDTDAHLRAIKTKDAKIGNLLLANGKSCRTRNIVLLAMLEGTTVQCLQFL